MATAASDTTARNGSMMRVKRTVRSNLPAVSENSPAMSCTISGVPAAATTVRMAMTASRVPATRLPRR